MKIIKKHRGTEELLLRIPSITAEVDDEEEEVNKIDSMALRPIIESWIDEFLFVDETNGYGIRGSSAHWALSTMRMTGQPPWRGFLQFWFLDWSNQVGLLLEPRMRRRRKEGRETTLQRFSFQNLLLLLSSLLRDFLPPSPRGEFVLLFGKETYFAVLMRVVKEEEGKNWHLKSFPTLLSFVEAKTCFLDSIVHWRCKSHNLSSHIIFLNSWQGK